jgi:hypothetical protein
MRITPATVTAATYSRLTLGTLPDPRVRPSRR